MKIPDSIREGRTYISLNQLDEIELDISNIERVMRYKLVLPILSGIVLDAGCGSGYGAFLMQKNPGVTKVIAIDNSEKALAYAKKEYKSKKIEFVSADISTFSFAEKVDFLVSLETIEHLKEPTEMVNLAKRVQAKNILLSFPAFKTVHYNPYHFYDFSVEDIQAIFSKWYKIKEATKLLNRTHMVHLVAKQNPK